MATEKVFEVNKEMELTSMMQLVDLNGSMVNFQSDFTITSTGDILVAIVNQHQLDNGEINFERVNGSYSRRIVYQDNVHQNHFLALKSAPSTTEKCRIIIRLREVLPNVRRKDRDQDNLLDKEERRVRFQEDANTPRVNTPRDRDPRDMRDIRDSAPRDREDPRDMRDMRDSTPRDRDPRDMRDMRDSAPRDIDSRASLPSTLEPDEKQEIHDQLQELYQQEDYTDNPAEQKPQPKHHNPYYLVGITCIVLFLLMVSYKFIRK